MGGGEPDGKRPRRRPRRKWGIVLKLTLKTYKAGMCGLDSLAITSIRVDKTTCTCNVLVQHVSTLTGHLQDKIHLCTRHKKDT